MVDEGMNRGQLIAGAGPADRWLEPWSKARALFPSAAHGMPRPAWATRGYEDDGAAAQERLTQLAPGRQGAVSVYVHVPFCETLCPFCDCHASLLPKRSPELVERYGRVLRREVQWWCERGALAERPVTTVHFGGGTPNSIPTREFEALVEAVASAFAVDELTEWAIETSCRCLDERHTARLADAGFTRIHVGVQALQPHLRSLLARREAPEVVLDRIGSCLDRGWVVSVDVLYGLPLQAVSDLREDLAALAATGVHGFSLYRLNHGRRNHHFMMKHGLVDRGPARLYADYRMFMDAAEMLSTHGYVKNHFTHFARREDRNLYSRHAVRGEDLVALGATADGSLGDYYYRHGGLDHYLAADEAGSWLEGGGLFTQAERKARGLVSQLMAGRVVERGLDPEGVELISRLEGAGLLRRDDVTRSWILTDVGSWFIEPCVSEALGIYQTAWANGDSAHRDDRV